MLQTQKKDAEPRRFYSIRQVSRDYLNGHYSEKRIRKLTQAGEIRAIRLGGRVLYDIRDLDAWINSLKSK